jgi:hypothetical protein
VTPGTGVWLRSLGLGLACLLCSPGAAASPDSEQARALDQRLHAAAAYLHAQIGASGQMVYRRDAISGEPLRERYNLLRHAGSVLALAEYHTLFVPDAGQRQAIDRALDFVRRCCLAPSQPGADDLAVWSPPEVERGRRTYALAKLGGAGLTLAALAQWRRVHPDGVTLAEMQALGRFILSMQGNDGRFRSLHAREQGQHDPRWESLYYPGEAALGLVLLFEHDRDPRWLEAAIDALQSLARQRETLSDPPPDHWALMATGRLWRQDPVALEAAVPDGFSWGPADGRRTAIAPLLMDHGLSVIRVMLGEQSRSPSLACARGSFTGDGRTTPTATRLEGLLGLLPVVPEGELRRAMGRSIDTGLAFVLAAQRLDGAVTGGFSRVTPSCPSDDARAHEVRIDYVQHALSAMQAYRVLISPP